MVKGWGIPAFDFIILMEVKRKFKRCEPLNAEDWRVVHEYGLWPEKVCGYKSCTNELGPRVDGERQKIDGKEVCDDCYFDSFGEELEKYPILSPRLRRRIASATKLANTSADEIQAHLAKIR